MQAWHTGRLMALVVGALFLGGVESRGEVKLPNVISSHMVLQQGVAAPIWGTASPGEEVTVQIGSQTKRATAAADGRWSVKLDPLDPVREPITLTVRGENTITIEDVLVGEVWVGSGQSNMAGAVDSYKGGDPQLARLAEQPSFSQIRLLKGNGTWQVATRENVGRFSALQFAFGEALQRELTMPVGLLVGAVGGTPSGYWLSPEALAADAECQRQIAAHRAENSPEKIAALDRATLERWETQVAAAKQSGKEPPAKPALLADQPKAGEGRAPIGHLYQAHIRPMVPFAIRGVLWDQGESGTGLTGVEQVALMGALIRGWRQEWNQGEFPFLYVQKPSGGGCAFDPQDPITSKASAFVGVPTTVMPMNPMREAFLHIRKHPNTAMVTASDLGAGIHPTNKWGYGQRAARVALGFVYGGKNAIYGPTYASHTIEGNKVRVRFENVGQGLIFRHGEKLQGFALESSDGSFAWADAVIDGESVVVSSAQVERPTAVRYAWSLATNFANLFNRDGLPALPFHSARP